MSDMEFRHFYGKARDAKRGGFNAWVVQSTGEKVAVALVLNRPDWLALMGYTIPGAIDRAGAEWVAMMERVARALEYGAEGEDDPPAGAQVGHRAWVNAGLEELGKAAQKLQE